MSAAGGMTVLAPADRTVPRMLELQAAAYGDRPLLTAPGGSWTYREARAAVAGRAASLATAGIARGDRVAILSPNALDMVEIVLACGWIGAVAVPINTASMGPQIAYYLKDSGAKLLVVEASLVDRLEHAAEGMGALRAIWVIGAAPDGGSEAPPLPLAGRGRGWGSLDDRASSAEPPTSADSETPTPNPSPQGGGGAPSSASLGIEPLPPRGAPIAHAPVGPGDTFAILYTSGTTGPSKGVMCPHAQYHWWGVHSGRLLGVTSDDVLCTTLPLFHINALNTFAQALLSGARMVLEPRFSASGFWPAMIRAEATVIYLLGAMVPILLAGEPKPEERQHRVRLGLGPGVPAHLSAAFKERTGVTLLEGYGSTEANFVIGAVGGLQKPGSMGRLVAGFSARVVDADDNELPPGEAGELILRADEPFSFATGYFGMPDKTVEAWRNLWFHTGDRVIRDADGFFRFVDRLKDAIRRRGENISSYEVEQVLLSHPDIDIAAVYPVGSELAEDEVMAALVPRPGAVIDFIALMQFCEPRLPHFAVPRFIDVVPDLPRTENGKVRKYVLRDRGVTATTWDREAAGYRRKRARR